MAQCPAGHSALRTQKQSDVLEPPIFTNPPCTISGMWKLHEIFVDPTQSVSGSTSGLYPSLDDEASTLGMPYRMFVPAALAVETIRVPRVGTVVDRMAGSHLASGGVAWHMASLYKVEGSDAVTGLSVVGGMNCWLTSLPSKGIFPGHYPTHYIDTTRQAFRAGNIASATPLWRAGGVTSGYFMGDERFDDTYEEDDNTGDGHHESIHGYECDDLIRKDVPEQQWKERWEGHPRQTKQSQSMRKQRRMVKRTEINADREKKNGAFRCSCRVVIAVEPLVFNVQSLEESFAYRVVQVIKHYVCKECPVLEYLKIEYHIAVMLPNLVGDEAFTISNNTGSQQHEGHEIPTSFSHLRVLTPLTPMRHVSTAIFIRTDVDSKKDRVVVLRGGAEAALCHKFKARLYDPKGHKHLLKACESYLRDKRWRDSMLRWLLQQRTSDLPRIERPRTSPEQSAYNCVFMQVRGKRPGFYKGAYVLGKGAHSGQWDEAVRVWERGQIVGARNMFGVSGYVPSLSFLRLFCSTCFFLLLLLRLIEERCQRCKWNGLYEVLQGLSLLFVCRAHLLSFCVHGYDIFARLVFSVSRTVPTSWQFRLRLDDGAGGSDRLTGVSRGLLFDIIVNNPAYDKPVLIQSTLDGRKPSEDDCNRRYNQMSNSPWGSGLRTHAWIDMHRTLSLFLPTSAVA